jgi:tetratricopeptide (TPR) repeat protein
LEISMSRSRRNFALAFLVLCSTVAAGLEDAAPGRDAGLRRLDSLYDHRGEVGVLDELIATVQQLGHASEDYDIVWRLARVWSWYAFTSDEKCERRLAAERALALGRRAMDLAPDRVEGYYTYAIATGVYANSIGAAQAFVRRVASDFERTMTRAYELDRHFDDGAPMIALGRYYYELPWPMRDLERSTRLLEEAVASHPHSARGHLYLAETYHASRRTQDARRALAAALQATSSDGGAAAVHESARRNLHRWFGETVLTASDDS